MRMWTNDLKKKALGLLDDGYSARQVALILGDGITRNAVCGMAHRAKSNDGAKPQAQARKPNRDVSKQPKVQKAKSVKSSPKLPSGQRPPATPEQIKVAEERAAREVEVKRSDLEIIAGKEPDPIGGKDFKGCRWIHGDPKHPDWRFCGHDQVVGKSYCQWHLSASYRDNGLTKGIVASSAVH